MKIDYVQYKADGPIYLHFGPNGTTVSVENHSEMVELVANLEKFANEIAAAESAYPRMNSLGKPVDNRGRFDLKLSWGPMG